MDQTLFMWISIIVISVLGTLAHFLYEISHHNKITGLFTAVNESAWEHIKIALTPTILWSLLDGAFFGAYMTLTLLPQHAPIFKDPLTGKYGFLAHSHRRPKDTTKKS